MRADHPRSTKNQLNPLARSARAALPGNDAITHGAAIIEN